MTDDAPTAAQPHLLRVLGLVFSLAVVVGGMIGSGIMRAPGVVALGITSPALILIAWAAGGGVALLSAMPLVEAGSSVPKAGGAYPIARRAFGPGVGLLAGWLNWPGSTWPRTPSSPWCSVNMSTAWDWRGASPTRCSPSA